MVGDDGVGMGDGDSRDLRVVGAGEDYRTAAGAQFTDQRDALCFRFSRPVNGLGEFHPEWAVVVDASESQVHKRQATKAGDGLVRAERAGAHFFEHRGQSGIVHVLHYRCAR